MVIMLKCMTISINSTKGQNNVCFKHCINKVKYNPPPPSYYLNYFSNLNGFGSVFFWYFLDFVSAVWQCLKVVMISILFFTGFKRKISSCLSVPSWCRSIRWSPVNTPPTLLTILTPPTTPSVTRRLLSPPSIWSFRVRGLSCLPVVAPD